MGVSIEWTGDAPYVCLWVGGVPDIQLGEGQEGDLAGQVHLVELHQYLGAHLIRLHNVVEQPGRRHTINKGYTPNIRSGA